MKRGAVYFVLIMILVVISAAEPPTERTVKGTVYKSDLTQTYSGMDVIVVNLNTSAKVQTKTYGPPVLPGIYSATIIASDNDSIYVRAWNASDWGNATGLMGITQTTIDIFLSRRSTFLLDRESSSAQLKPAGPAPIMITSKNGIIILYEIYSNIYLRFHKSK